MKTTFLNKIEDMQWLMQTHLKPQMIDHGDTIKKCNSVILYGNEDSPERVDLHWRENPLANEMAAMCFLQDPESGDLVSVLP